MDCLGKMQDGGERMTYDHDGAMREPSTGKGRYDLISPFAMQRIALWYELGSRKYAPRNWEKGIPFSRCIDSAKRHIDKFLMGMDDEDHLAAACWNIMSIMHYQMLGMHDFDDLPKYNIPKCSDNGIEEKGSDLDIHVTFENEDDATSALDAMNHVIDAFSRMFGLSDAGGALASSLRPSIVPVLGGYRIKFPEVKGIRDSVESAKNKEENN